MDIEARDEQGCLVLDVLLKDLDSTVNESVKNQIFAIIDSQTAPKVLLNLTRVNFMDSSAIGSLVSVRNSIVARKGAIALYGLHPHVRKIIRVVTLDTIFDIYEDEASGLASLTGA